MQSHTHTHTHPFNGPFSGTTRVSRYQIDKTNLHFTEARDSEWWHQLGHIMEVCISLQTDNHASAPPLKFFTGWMPFLPPNQQCQSTEGTMQSVTAKPHVVHAYYSLFAALTSVFSEWNCHDWPAVFIVFIDLDSPRRLRCLITADCYGCWKRPTCTHSSTLFSQQTNKHLLRLFFLSLFPVMYFMYDVIVTHTHTPV